MADQILERGHEQLEDALRDVPGIGMAHINGYAPTLTDHDSDIPVHRPKCQKFLRLDRMTVSR